MGERLLYNLRPQSLQETHNTDTVERTFSALAEWLWIGLYVWGVTLVQVMKINLPAMLKSQVRFTDSVSVWVSAFTAISQTNVFFFLPLTFKKFSSALKLLYVIVYKWMNSHCAFIACWVDFKSQPMHCFRKNLCSSSLSDWILQFESRPWLCSLFISPLLANSKLNHCVLIDRAWAQFDPPSLGAASDWLRPHVVLPIYLLDRMLSTTTCRFAACVCLHFNEQSSLFCLPALATFFFDRMW